MHFIVAAVAAFGRPHLPSLNLDVEFMHDAQRGHAAPHASNRRACRHRHVELEVTQEQDHQELPEAVGLRQRLGANTATDPGSNRYSGNGDQRPPPVVVVVVGRTWQA